MCTTIVHRNMIQYIVGVRYQQIYVIVKFWTRQWTLCSIYSVEVQTFLCNLIGLNQYFDLRFCIRIRSGQKQKRKSKYLFRPIKSHTNFHTSLATTIVWSSFCSQIFNYKNLSHTVQLYISITCGYIPLLHHFCSFPMD